VELAVEYRSHLIADYLAHLINLIMMPCGCLSAAFSLRRSAPMVPQSGDRLPPPASLARRHFMGIVAAGAGRLSVIAASSALLPGTSANAMGWFPKGDSNGGAPGLPGPYKPGPGPGGGHGPGPGGGHNPWPGGGHGPRPGGGHSPQCFGRGTLVQTARGDVAVEDLAIGEMVMTANGALPIKWVGRHTIRRNGSASWHPSVMPIRVARFAIDDQTPRRDLYLSPNHSLLIEGVLIPVKHLVNESSIAVDEAAKASEEIAYFCVELDTHEVIYAEGVAAETFQYTGGQIAWDNLADYQALYGREHKLMPAFAPLCRYKGGRAEAGALLRLAASRFVDVRDPIQVAYERIAARAVAA
jgi:hypothetical protein